MRGGKCRRLLATSTAAAAVVRSKRVCRSEACFTKYLTTVLRLPYDNAKLTIDLRLTSNLSNILRKRQRQFLCTIYMQNRKIV